MDGSTEDLNDHIVCHDFEDQMMDMNSFQSYVSVVKVVVSKQEREGERERKQKSQNKHSKDRQNALSSAVAHVL